MTIADSESKERYINDPEGYRLARGAGVPITPCPAWCDLGPEHPWEWDRCEPAPERTHVHKSDVAGLELEMLGSIKLTV
jgi:hypothetical protein